MSVHGEIGTAQAGVDSRSRDSVERWKHTAHRVESGAHFFERDPFRNDRVFLQHRADLFYLDIGHRFTSVFQL
ncbi:MAG: hypothetical protein ACU85U_03080 [Gammaproteobacteria bacterium]|jgi:hypothetical protein